MITTAPNTQTGVIKPLGRAGCLPVSIRTAPTRRDSLYLPGLCTLHIQEAFPKL